MPEMTLREEIIKAFESNSKKHCPCDEYLKLCINNCDLCWTNYIISLIRERVKSSALTDEELEKIHTPCEDTADCPYTVETKDGVSTPCECGNRLATKAQLDKVLLALSDTEGKILEE